MAVLYSLVSCCEEHGTVTENISKGAGDASVTLRCSWANRWLLVADIVGNRNVWPYAPGLRGSAASIVPFPAAAATDGQALVYEEALVTVKYTSKEEENLVAESIEPTAEFITLDHKRFRWLDEGSETPGQGDPLSEAEAPGQQLHSLMLARTHYQVEPPLPVEIISLVGSANDAAYVSALLGLTFDEETLLFLPASLSRTITTSGDRAFDISLKFPYKPSGWNRYWRAKTQQYAEIYDVEAEAVYKGYPLADFSAFLV